MISGRVAFALGALVVASLAAGYVLFRAGPLRSPPAPALPSAPPVPSIVAPDTPAGPIQFDDVTERTGITFRHTDGSSGRHYIVEAMSTGLATFDYDGDGLVDIYFPNGAPLPGMQVDVPPRHALYRNVGNWQFEEVTDEAGVVYHCYGLGITAGDYDNDGFADLYLNNFGRNVLCRNNGDGTFTDLTDAAGVARGELVGAGACFLDIEADGDLDLYVGNYIELDLDSHITRSRRGVPHYPSPREYAPVPDTLYANNGDGTFRDVSRESGVGLKAGRSMGMICADYDGDGDTDVFICNDVQENFLFRNDGSGRYEEVAGVTGVAFNADGEVLANMAVDCADADGDGWLDFYTTNYQHQSPVLFRNLGNGFFEDVTRQTQAGAGGFEHVNWGCGFADFDNDGYRDLYVANGHTEDTLEQLGMAGHRKARNVLLRNGGRGTFEDVSRSCGPGLLPEFVSRGIALDDLDHDGDVDVAVVNSRDPPTLLRNRLAENGNARHWLQIQLRGVRVSRDAVGARVEVRSGDLRLVEEVHSGRGYQSHWGSVLHFGLGARERVDQITVRWIGGAISEFHDLDIDQHIVIIEDSKGSGPILFGPVIALGKRAVEAPGAGRTRLPSTRGTADSR
jgi:hypothetical protein